MPDKKTSPKPDTKPSKPKTTPGRDDFGYTPPPPPKKRKTTDKKKGK